MKYIRTLSIKQPWLYCITDLPPAEAKRIENRTWGPPSWLIGERIALHASKAWDTRAGIAAASRLAGQRLEELMPLIPTGAVVATAVLVGWIHMDGTAGGRSVGSVDALARYRYSPWFFGPVGWILDDVQKLSRPVPARGARGLWRWWWQGASE